MSGVLAGLGAALQPVQGNMQQLQAFKMKMQQDALNMALKQQEMQLQQQQEERAGRQFELNSQLTQHQIDRLPIEDALKSLDVIQKRDPIGIFNNPQALEMAKSAGVPFDMAPSIPQVAGPLDNQAFRDNAVSQGVAPDTGAVIPPAIQQLIMKQNLTSQALSGMDVNNPTDLQYNLMTGDNKPISSISSQFGGFGEYLNPQTKQYQTLPNIIGWQNGWQKYHNPVAQFNFVPTNDGIQAGNRFSGGLSPIQGPNGQPVQPPAPAGLKADAIGLAPLKLLSEEFKNLIPKVNTAGGGLMNRGKQYLKNEWGALTQTNEPAAQMASLANRYMATLARMSGERGVLTEQDVQRAQAWVPSLSDAGWMATWKQKQFEAFLNEKEKALASQGVKFPSILNQGQNPSSNITSIQWDK